MTSLPQRTHKPGIGSGERKRNERQASQKASIRKERLVRKAMKRRADGDVKLPVKDLLQVANESYKFLGDLFYYTDEHVPQEWVKENIYLIRKACADMTKDPAALGAIRNFTARNDIDVVGTVLFENDIVKKCMSLLHQNSDNETVWVIIGHLSQGCAKFRDAFLTGGLLGLLVRKPVFDEFSFVMFALFYRTGMLGNAVPPINVVKLLINKFRQYTIEQVDQLPDMKLVTGAWMSMSKSKEYRARLGQDTQLMITLLIMGGADKACQSNVITMLSFMAEESYYHEFLVTKINVFSLVVNALKTGDPRTMVSALKILGELAANLQAHVYFIDSNVLALVYNAYTLHEDTKLRLVAIGIFSQFIIQGTYDTVADHILTQPRYIDMLCNAFSYYRDAGIEYLILDALKRLLHMDSDGITASAIEESGCVEKIERLTFYPKDMVISQIAEEVLDKLQQKMDLDDEYEEEEQGGGEEMVFGF